MQGTIIESSSGKKLSLLVVLLIVAQIVCFLIGNFIAKRPTSNQNILSTACQDVRINGSESEDDNWYYPSGKGFCRPVNVDKFTNDNQYQAHSIVYTFQMPIPRGGRNLSFSRWHRNLIGILHLDVTYHSQFQMAPRTKITLDARLAYRNKNDADDNWKLYAASLLQRNLECTKVNEEEFYNCRMVPLFELGSLHHEYYLLNIRLPADTDKNTNEGLGRVTDLWITAINQNGNFTKMWVTLKTIFFSIIICFLAWYWRRVAALSREPVLLEYMLFALGLSLTILDMPLEYLTLVCDMPFMVLLRDIIHAVFYFILLSFWLIFAGEHLTVQEDEQENTLKSYWPHISIVAVGCLSLFMFDICEHSFHLRNPFYLFWITDFASKLALSFMILAGISAGFYLLFLTYMIWKVFANISLKKTSLPSMSSARRLHYDGITYRFKLLMITTLLCAALTILVFFLGQVAERQWQWDEDLKLETISPFFTGMYGMWTIYILALLCLYAPCHKQWPAESSGK